MDNADDKQDGCMELDSWIDDDDHHKQACPAVKPLPRFAPGSPVRLGMMFIG